LESIDGKSGEQESAYGMSNSRSDLVVGYNNPHLCMEGWISTIERCYYYVRLTLFKEMDTDIGEGGICA
jgi:hypothetical protein